jgi:hypothetical protein
VAQSKDSDPQKARLYAMEFREFRGLWRGTRTKLKTLRRYVRLVCRLYGIKPCTLYVRAYSTKGCYGGGAIHLDPYGMNAHTLAHELAHYINDMLDKGSQDHGPRFVRRYGEVLHILRLFPIEGFRAICRKHGIRIARPKT